MKRAALAALALAACAASAHDSWFSPSRAKIVKVYLDKVRACLAVRGAWAKLQARGLRWRESCRKFARIELPPELPLERQPVGLPLELAVLGNAVLTLVVELR